MAGQVLCKECGLLLDEGHDQPDRRPCPRCGSINRHYVESAGTGPQTLHGKTLVRRPKFIPGTLTQENADTMSEWLRGDREYGIRVIDLPSNMRFVAVRLPDGTLQQLGVGDVEDALIEAIILIGDAEEDGPKE